MFHGTGALIVDGTCLDDPSESVTYFHFRSSTGWTHDHITFPSLYNVPLYIYIVRVNLSNIHHDFTDFHVVGQWCSVYSLLTCLPILDTKFVLLALIS